MAFFNAESRFKKTLREAQRDMRALLRNIITY